MYKRLGDYIREVNVRNSDLKVAKLVGLTIDKAFIPSVANIIGTDLSNYKVIRKEQFACSLMQVSRDERIPVAMFEEEEAIMSPAYPMFEVIDKTLLLPKYLMMWFSRKEFDREASFYAVGGVRGSLTWEDFCNMRLPIPSIDRQREIVSEYETLSNRIRLNEQMIANLEETAQALYRKMFVDGVDKENLPEGWRIIPLGSLCETITKGTTPTDFKSDGTVSYIKAESFTPDHNFAKERFMFIDEVTHKRELKRSILQEGDILFTIAGTLGKLGYVTNDILPANTNQAVAIIRVDNNLISPIDIYSMFIGGAHDEYCKRNIQQAVQANLSLDTLSNMPLVLPTANILKTYHEQIGPIFNAIRIYQQEKEKLTELQSLLLAKMGE
jgi:type I restriction enzyme S subunit